jgi:hypothetical protein
VVQEGVRRLLAVSDAPGMLEVYEADGRTTEVDGSQAYVFVHAGQEPAGDISPELQHAPPPR